MKSYRYMHRAGLILRVVALSVLLLVVSVQATVAVVDDGEEMPADAAATAIPAPPAAAAAHVARQDAPNQERHHHSVADSVRLHDLVQRAARRLSEIKNRKKDANQNAIASSDPETTGGQDDPPSERRLGGTSLSEKLDKCRSKLETCEAEAKADAPTFLFTQIGHTCKLKRKERGGGTYSYEFSSKDLDGTTYAFSDRPYRIAYSMPTEEFVADFSGMFSQETGGSPNGALTFRHEDSDAFEGPLIAVYVDAAYKKSSGKYVYELSQSKDEAEVNALDDFFQDGDVVEYESCSLFIDSVATGGWCPISTTYTCPSGGEPFRNCGDGTKHSCLNWTGQYCTCGCIVKYYSDSYAPCPECALCCTNNGYSSTQAYNGKYPCKDSSGQVSYQVGYGNTPIPKCNSSRDPQPNPCYLAA
jgi:hypothetical protein